MLVSATQQSGWENNLYVLTTTRILVLAGVVYSCRSLYFLVTRYSFAVTDTTPIARASNLQSFDLLLCKYIAEASRCPVGTPQGQIGVDINNIALDTSSMASMDSDIDISINDDLELGLQQPRRSHQSHHYLYRPRAHRHEQPQRTEASTVPGNPIATAEQCTSVHSKSADVGVENMLCTLIAGGHEGILLLERVPDERLSLE